MTSATERRELLKTVYEEARGCVACSLHQTRTTVVFGSGNADADLMFIGEAPGANEDTLGLPFVGQAGKLLDKLLGEIGLDRADVFIANTVKCRPPNNRDPHPHEIESCNGYLRRQVELIEPSVICTLGNFATKLLLQTKEGITKLRGQEFALTRAGHTAVLIPTLHPSAVLRSGGRALAESRADFVHVKRALGVPDA